MKFNLWPCTPAVFKRVPLLQLPGPVSSPESPEEVARVVGKADQVDEPELEPQQPEGVARVPVLPDQTQDPGCQGQSEAGQAEQDASAGAGTGVAGGNARWLRPPRT